MRFFLHHGGLVRLVDANGGDITLTESRFQELEPFYPGLPTGATGRYWTAERAYFEGGIPYDGHECGGYCDKASLYTAYPTIYVDVSLSQTTLDITQAETITVSASLKDAFLSVLPITQTWYVRLSHTAGGDVDRLKLDFVDGVCSLTYHYHDHLPLGSWFIDESKFDLFEFGGVTYGFKLLNPVNFIVYRSA